MGKGLQPPQQSSIRATAQQYMDLPHRFATDVVINPGKDGRQQGQKEASVCTSHLHALAMSDWRIRAHRACKLGKIRVTQVLQGQLFKQLQSLLHKRRQLGENYKLCVLQSRFVNYVSSYKTLGHAGEARAPEGSGVSATREKPRLVL